MSLDEVQIEYKIWLKRNKENILGKGGAALLENIDKFGDRKLKNDSEKKLSKLLKVE